MELRKSILIIKANPKSLVGVETFLKNRGWILHSTTDMKDGFSYLVKNKPPIVMVAVDHPIKKIRMLPKLLSQAYPVCVLAFVESTSTHSYKLLMGCGVDYKINPPATGPAVERAVNKFVKDQQASADESVAKEKSDKVIAEKATHSNNEVITGGKAYSKNHEVFNFSSKSTADPNGKNFVAGGESAGSEAAVHETLERPSDALDSLLDQMTDTEADAEALMAQALALSRGPAYRPDHGDAKPVGSVYYPDQKPKGPGFTPQYSEEDVSGAGYGSVRTENPKGNDLNAEQKGPKGEPLIARADGAGPGDLLSAEAKAKKGSLLEGQSGTNPSSEMDHKNSGRPDPLPLDARFQKSSSQQRSGPPESDDKKRAQSQLLSEKDDEDSILARGSDQALSENVIPGDGIVKQKLQDNTHVACIVVHSARFSGYLVAAMGKNRKIDQDFMNQIRGRLSRYLKEQGEEIKDEDNLNINIQEVDFEGWSIEYADFLRKSVHKGDELALAFFPFSKVKNELGPSAVMEMGSVKLEDLQGDIQIEFNLYVYLAANNRYVLYTPRGAIFYGDQKERLNERGVTHLHMRKSEAQDLSKYRAQNYLNSKINEYLQKKGLKKSA